MDSYRYLILGGGMVAGYAARELVERGMGKNELGILSADDVRPYERPPLSKGFLAGKDAEASVFIAGNDFFSEHGIDLQLRTHVTALDISAKRVQCDDGRAFGYERLLIATGSRVQTFADFGVPGAELANVFTLRSLDDAKRIQQQAQAGRRAVVIGAGFIGIETASVMRERGLETTMLFPEDRFWPKFFTPEMSGFYRRYYEQRGVQIRPGQEIARFDGDGSVAAVLTRSGERLPCDLVLCGLGMAENTNIYKQAGISTDNGVRVDTQLRTSAPDVWAAGDIANWDDTIFATHRRLEHWDIAVEQGKLAARNLLGAGESYRRVPYYFSDEFDLSFEYWGAQEGHDRAITRGSLDEKSASVWFLKGDRLLAAFVMNRPDEERELAERWIAEHTPVAAATLADASRPLQTQPRPADATS
jgi:NADPH-dependent 2,4-dienoyl-CoA reductase/sulfur reductase-like enzyme